MLPHSSPRQSPPSSQLQSLVWPAHSSWVVCCLLDVNCLLEPNSNYIHCYSFFLAHSILYITVSLPPVLVHYSLVLCRLVAYTLCCSSSA
mmetsp:Transcript_858/g.1498  ORF Transcript_858/g.1498 Transcript_858/m.1498 type:complete len:90 (-) Transcript_858:71-340(-)